MKWLLLLPIAGLLYWAGNSFIEAKHAEQKDPFWEGIQTVQVCKVPYYSSKDCYQLQVDLSDDKKSAQINFTNGGYKYVSGINCWNAATATLRQGEPDSVFCRSYDSDGNQWDFMPTWVNY